MRGVDRLQIPNHRRDQNTRKHPSFSGCLEDDEIPTLAGVSGNSLHPRAGALDIALAVCAAQERQNHNYGPPPPP